MTRTTCEECDHVHPASRKLSPSAWLCMKFPRMEGDGFVAPRTWVTVQPYMRCSGINGGACCLFKKRRDGQQEADL